MRRKMMTWIWAILLVLVAFAVPSIAREQSLSKIHSPPMGEGQGEGVQETTRVQVQETYGKLPLYFIQNNGQVDEKVKFYEKGSGHATFFTKEGVYISLNPQLIKLTFLNANPNPEIVAEGLQEGKVNYLVGSDPKRWRTHIPTYQAVTYKGVYRDIDLKFYGNNRQMEYDIIVKAGADPSQVRFAYEGIERLQVSIDGDLEIGLKEGKIVQRKPVVYQEIDGERLEIQAGYVILGRNTAGFRIAAYDQGRPLIIDPVLIYSIYLAGGSVASFEQGYGIAVDASGNAYVTGYSGSPDGSFPTTVNAFQPNFGGGTDAFVTKLYVTGGTLIYSTYLGGADVDVGRGIMVDGSGNAYVTGYTSSSDFPRVNALQPNFGGIVDAFVAKLNSTGSALVYSTFLGGSDEEEGYDIAIDGSQNAYVTGYTGSPTDFPVANALQAVMSSGTGGDAFVSKINGAGSQLVYSTYLGGNGNDTGFGIAVDSNGNAYITGTTGSSNFSTSNVLQQNFGGGSEDAFVVKLNATGSARVYATYLGGSSSTSEERGYDIWVDGSGNAYVTGVTGSSSGFPTVNALQPNYGGGGDAFIAKLNPAGSALVYSTFLGGAGLEMGKGIALDGVGDVYIVGRTDSSSGFPTVNALQPNYGGGGDAFIAKLNPAGSALVYSTYWGGSGFDAGHGIAVDGLRNAYVTGNSSSSDFPTTVGSPIAVLFAFVTKLGDDAGIALPQTGQTTCYDSAGAVIPCAGTGQDGEVLAGVVWPNPRFTVSGDCVRDNLTGLMWVKAPDSTTRTWQDALNYANGLSLCGYTDWRLPNVNELESLYHAGQSNSNTWLNTQGFSISASLEWSSTSDAGSPSSAWRVAVWEGVVGLPSNQSSKWDINNVWPVRSGQPGVAPLWKTGQTTCYNSAGSVIPCTGTGQDGEIQAGAAWPSPRFTVSGDCVIDDLTGLMWTKDANLSNLYGSKTWQDALNYANGLSLCGYDDWRLPNRKELHSLTDFSRYNPALPSGHPSPNVAMDSYCSSTTFPASTGTMNVVSMANGYMSALIKSAVCYYWPVRSGRNTPIGLYAQPILGNVSVTFGTVTLHGNTVVTISQLGPTPPIGYKLGTTPAYYEITTTAAFTGPVEVCIDYDETQFQREQSLKLFHYPGGGWDNITTTLDTAGNRICGETTSFSPFIVAEELSTAVTLQNISAHLEGNQVILSWSTSFEVDNEGFVVLRSESPNGPFTPITQGMIPAMGGGFKAAYTFTDANIEQGKTYYYRLQDIDTKGVVTAHNIVPVTIAVAGGKGATGSVKEKDEIASGTSSPRNDSENNNSGMDKIAGGTDGSQGLNDASQQQNRPNIWMSGVATDMEWKTTTGSAAMADSIDGIKGLSTQQGGQDQVAMQSPGSPSAQLEGSHHAMIHEGNSTPLSESTHSIMDSSITGEGYGPSSFSVTIEDRMGNLIKIKRMEGASPPDSAATADSESTTLKVSEESGHVVVTWQGAGSGKGFVLYRTEKGKENYSPISGTIPYFGRNGKERYRYLFIDKGAKSVKEYEYRLEIVSGDAVDKVAKQ